MIFHNILCEILNRNRDAINEKNIKQHIFIY